MDKTKISIWVKLLRFIGVLSGLLISVIAVVSLPLIVGNAIWAGVYEYFNGYWPYFDVPPLFNLIKDSFFFSWRGGAIASPLDWMWIARVTLYLLGPIFSYLFFVNLLVPASWRIYTACGYKPVRIGKSDLQEFVDRLSKRYKGPRADVWLIADGGVTAFALNNPLQHQSIVISQGIVGAMPKEMVNWILAHEYAHIYHGDTRSSTFWILSMRSIYLFSRIRFFFAKILFYVLGEMPFLRLLTFPLALLFNVIMIIASVGSRLGRWVFLLFDRWASRHMEFAADEFAAINMGPRYGISLFSNLRGNMEPLFNGLFATHPTHSQRIKKLVAMEVNKAEH